MTRRGAGSYHIEIERAACVSCAGCVSICPTLALDMHAVELRCEDALCIGCDLCVRFCPVVALGLEQFDAQPATSAD